MRASLAIAVAVAVSVAAGAPARASELPHRMGMYTPAGATLAMLDSKLAVSVHGAIVETVVTQTYRNDTDRVVEATYIFPLPDDAAVSAMAIDYGSRKVHAAIALRKDAQRRYEEAVSAGLGAGLLDQERPDVFTQTVSAVPAHGTVEVTLRYDTVARYAGGTWQLVLPMVVAPRYVPGAATGRATTGTGRAPDTDRAPDASRVTPTAAPGAGGKTEVTLAFADAVDDVASPTHELGKQGEAYAFADAHSDHDAVIRWRAKAPSEGWVEQDDDGAYAAVLVEAPPAAARKTAVRVMIVLDRAATARGDVDAISRPLVRSLIGAMDAKDSVSVTGSLDAEGRSPDEVARAVEAAWNRQSSAFDLTKELAKVRARGAAVVLVSDGLVADDKAVLAAAKQVGAPIHVIGVGPAPNRALLAQLASTTGGTIRFATVGDDLAALARDALVDLSAQPPVLAVSWGALTAHDIEPAQMPRLGAGQAVLVIAKVDRARAANARARGDVFLLGAIAPSRAIEGTTTPKGPLARRWARIKLDELIASGAQSAVATHAMRYGLVSPMTSMIAIGDEVVATGGVKHTVPVPVSVPSGMHWQNVQRELAVDTTNPVTGTTTQVELPKALKKRPVAKAPPVEHAPPVEEPYRQTEAKPEPKTEPTTTPKTEPKKKARDFAGDDSDARGANDEEAEGTTTITRDHVQNLPSPAPTVAGEDVGAYGGEDRAEAISVEGTAYSPSRTRLRFSVATGAAREAGETTVLIAPRLSFEVGRRTRFGLEGSMWLVGGLNLEGTVLSTISRIGVSRWLDVVGGLGLHLGNGLGPAGAVELRVRLPVRHVATYLRYDGALLLHDSSQNGQNAGSVGIEASF